MADTLVATNLIQKHWARKLWLEIPDRLWWAPYIGESENNVIQTKTELEKGQGDKITFGIAVELKGEGTEGDNKLEDSEEELVTYDDAIFIDQLRNAVRLKGRMDEKKASFDMRTIAKDRLKIWMPQTIDRHIFRQLSGETTYTFAGNTGVAPDTNHIMYGGAATSKASLTTADTLTLALIDKAREWAEAEQTINMRPFMDKDDSPLWLLVIHPRQAYDLKGTTAYTQAAQYAQERGKSNPLFTGALMAWNGVIIKSHPKVRLYTDYGSSSNVHAARALFLGAQAGCLAYGGGIIWEEKSFDYGNKHGFATGRIFGVKKARFNSEDYGVMTIDTAAAKP